MRSRALFIELLISTEPPLCGGVRVHGTGKLGIYNAVKTKVIFTWQGTNSWIKLAAFVGTVDVQKVSVDNLPKPGCPVYAHVTTDVDKLGLETYTWTYESEDIGVGKPSTDIIFVMVDTVFFKTAGSPPVGWYVS